jgi:hypothetical protein
MATTTHYFSGVARQLFLTRPDQFGNYTVGVELDAASHTELANSGTTLKPRTWEGHTFVTFRRPKQKVIKDQLVQFGPPVVIDANGQPMTKMVGKGSKVTIKVVVYDSMKGKGHRLDTVRVDELVEYVPQPQPQAQTGAVAAAAATPAAPRQGIPF